MSITDSEVNTRKDGGLQVIQNELVYPRIYFTSLISFNSYKISFIQVVPLFGLGYMPGAVQIY